MPPRAFTSLAGILLSSLPCAAGDPDVSGEVFYQIMPIAWRDSNGDANRFGDFGGLTASLGYLKGLGVTGVYLQPIFPSPAYHGYQHGDAGTLNPWFGAEAEFVGFVRAAHAGGIKVYLDFVAYGISTDTEWFRDARGNTDSPYSSWLAFTDAAHTKWKGHSYTTWNGARVGFVHWNLADRGPVTLVTSWAGKWLDPNGDGDFADGVDGYRLDHAYAAAPEGWGATIRFWESWAAELRRKNPDVFVFAEPGDWASRGAEMMTPGGFDAVIAKPWEMAARKALETGDARPLYAATTAALAALPAGKALVAEVGDHDSDRIASVVGGDPAREKLAAAILLTSPWTPSIYFGDEIGMRGRKSRSYPGDAADIPMREPFKWKAVAGPPMSNYVALCPEAWEGRVSRDGDGRSVEEQEGVAGSVLEEYRRLIAARRASPALRKGSYEPLKAGSDVVWAFVRRSGDAMVLVAINLSGDAAALKVDLSSVSGAVGPVRDLLGDTPRPAVTGANRAGYDLPLGPHAYTLLSIGGPESRN